MKKFFKLSVAALAAVLLTTVLVSATVAAIADEKVEFSSSAMPNLNCSIALSQAKTIFNLMPQEIKSVCRDEFRTVSAKCARKSDFTYQGVRIRTTPHDGLVDVSFTYAGYRLTVKNATWERMKEFFAE